MRSLSRYDDEKLVAMLGEDKKSAEAAFRVLYDRHAPMVNAYCRKAVGNKEQAEDIFQEAFVRFFRNVKTDYKLTNVPGYLLTIARNLCLNYKRDKKPDVSLDDIELRGDVIQDYEQRELLELIDLALDLLDFEFKEAFIMREYNELPYKEIAEITGTTLSNAKSRVYRAKKKIKEILNPYLKELTK